MPAFSTPLAFLLLLAIPFIWKRREKASQISIPLPGITTLNGVSIGRSTEESRVITNILKAAAIVCLALALARPQSSFSYSDTTESGRDIMLTLDLSGSMRALDYFIDGERVDRLTALKLVVKEFINERVGDRMGLVIFGSDVHTQSPLTGDHTALTEIVNSLQVGMAGDGTAIGDGLAISLKRLRSISGNSKIVVLVTDGAQTAGVITPKQAANVAKNLGIKVYTIGIGGDKPAPIKILGMFGEPVYRYIPAERDEATMKQVAEITGGRYFQGENLEKLKEIYAEISKIEERTAATKGFVVHEEHFLPLLLCGLGILVLHELLLATRYRTVP